MNVEELIAQLKPMSLEQIVAWMIENLGHAHLKECLRQLEQQE